MLREFAQTKGIAFPLLSDQGSRVITELGLLDRDLAAHHAAFNVPTGDPQWGVAYPAVFVLDEGGRVAQKRIQEHYRAREGAVQLLEDALGVGAASHGQTQTASTPRVRVSVFADSDSYVRWQNTRLHVVLDVDSGWHVYGRPAPTGYTPMTLAIEPQSGLQVGEPLYPPARLLKIESLADQFFVYEGRVHVTIPIAINVLAGHGDVMVRITIRYQACNDVECVPPSEAELEIPLQETPAA